MRAKDDKLICDGIKERNIAEIGAMHMARKLVECGERMSDADFNELWDSHLFKIFNEKFIIEENK